MPAPPLPSLAGGKPLKILMVGAIGVGKTSLAKRLAHGGFEPGYRTTVGVDVIRCDFENGAAGPARLIIWDTDGDFGHSIFASPYISGVAGVMGVADATRPGSIRQMVSLLRAFERADPKRPTCAALTKSDLGPDGVPPVGGLDARPVFHVSAATGRGVLQAFGALAQAIARAG